MPMTPSIILLNHLHKSTLWLNPFVSAFILKLYLGYKAHSDSAAAQVQSQDQAAPNELEKMENGENESKNNIMEANA